jgi:hypothetical protein
MLEDLAKKLAEFELPLTRSGLPENYLTIPDIAEKVPIAVVREAWKWAVAIRENEYRKWLRVWRENTPEQWEMYDLYDHSFEEIRILKGLQHNVRVAFTVKKNRPRLFKKGYQDYVTKAIQQKARASRKRASRTTAVQPSGSSESE